MNWSENVVKKLLEQGKIVAFTITGNKKKLPAGARKRKGDEEKAKIAWALREWCRTQGVRMETEFRFHELREWRFDWAVPALKIAVEYEGIFSEKSGHTTPAGYSKDTEKYNAAQARGWQVVRFTALTIGNVTETMNECLSKF